MLVAFAESSHVDLWDYSEWPKLEEGQTEMEFHLVYQGRLPAAGQSNTRAREKHDIRKVFHKQLASLWKTHPFLIGFMELDERQDRERGKNHRFISSSPSSRTQVCGSLRSLRLSFHAAN